MEGRRLFMWRCKPGESSISSYVSAITSSGQRKWHDSSSKYALPSAWVAVGFNSGECRLLDYRSGNLVVNWRAHDASITKVLLRNFKTTGAMLAHLKFKELCQHLGLSDNVQYVLYRIL